MPFFLYGARIGRCAIGSPQSRRPSQAPRWHAQGVSLVFLRSFWKTLWASWHPRWISYFLWMVVHKGLPVGSWLRQMGQEGCCQVCQESEETSKHCLWGCTRAQEVWRGALGIVVRTTLKLGPITWGAFCWCSIAEGHHVAEESDPQDPVYLIAQGAWVSVIEFPWLLRETNAGAHVRRPVWEIIGSIMGWHIWTSCCVQILGG